jgi:hypothetical protein
MGVPVDRQRLAERTDCSLRLTALQRDDAQIVQAAEMIAVRCQHLAIEIFRLGELSGLVMLQGAREYRIATGQTRANAPALRAGSASILSIHGCSQAGRSVHCRSYRRTILGIRPTIPGLGGVSAYNRSRICDEAVL